MKFGTYVTYNRIAISLLNTSPPLATRMLHSPPWFVAWYIPLNAAPGANARQKRARLAQFVASWATKKKGQVVMLSCICSGVIVIVMKPETFQKRYREAIQIIGQARIDSIHAIHACI